MFVLFAAVEGKTTSLPVVGGTSQFPATDQRPLTAPLQVDTAGASRDSSASRGRWSRTRKRPAAAVRSLADEAPRENRRLRSERDMLRAPRFLIDRPRRRVRSQHSATRTGLRPPRLRLDSPRRLSDFDPVAKGDLDRSSGSTVGRLVISDITRRLRSASPRSRGRMSRKYITAPKPHPKSARMRRPIAGKRGSGWERRGHPILAGAHGRITVPSRRRVVPQRWSKVGLVGERELARPASRRCRSRGPGARWRRGSRP